MGAAFEVGRAGRVDGDNSDRQSRERGPSVPSELGRPFTMDELGVALESLLSRFRDQKITVVQGALSEDTTLPTVCLDSERDVAACCDAFFEAATGMAAKYIVVEARRLQQDDLDGALNEADGSEDADPIVRNDVLKELRRCRDRVGQVCSFTVLFIATNPAVVFSLEYFASWNEHVFGTTDLLEGSDEEDEDVEELSEREVTELAKKLAADQRFQKATRPDGRMFVARKVFGDKAEEYGSQLEDIISEAKNIFELEIKAAKEDQLRARATAMLKEGGSRSAIAAALGLTTYRLSKLLEEASPA